METSDVREIFSPFGEIVNMDIAQDDIARTNKGFAYIEYKTAKVKLGLQSILDQGQNVVENLLRRTCKKVIYLSHCR